MKFLIVNFDGYNVGVEGSFNSTWLCFDTFEEAYTIMEHWLEWSKNG